MEMERRWEDGESRKREREMKEGGGGRKERREVRKERVRVIL